MPEQTYKKILFPTDFTEASDYAMTYAVSMAKRYKARLHIIHVVDTTFDIAGFYVPHVSTDKIEEQMRKSAEDRLKKICSSMPRGIKVFECSVRIGIPYKEILKYAGEKAIDLIIMGSHGRSGVDHFFFGSTTERTLRQAACPVLTVRPA